MLTYTFVRGEQPPCFTVVDVWCGAERVARLDMANRIQRGHNIALLEKVLGERAVTKLMAFGEVQTIEVGAPVDIFERRY